jgi:hypothetical protein
MRICFTFNGQTFCFYIPVIYWPWPWHIPDPGPEKVEQWLISQAIKPEVVRELQGLATLHAVGNRLGGELGASVRSLVQEKVKALSLPTGASIEYNEAVQR